MSTNLLDSTNGINPKDYQSLREIFLQSVGLKSVTDLDEASFIINPPTDKVELYVKKAGSLKKPMKLTPSPEGIVSMDSLEDHCSYEVEVFSSATKPPLRLHNLVIIKTDKGVDVQIVDTKASIVETKFFHSDNAVDDAKVLGKFTNSKGETVSIEGSTDSDGSFVIVLPPGTINNLSATKQESSIVVQKNGIIEVPPPDNSNPFAPRTTFSISIDINSSSFQNAVNSVNSKIAILGDTSGSMYGQKMDILKKSFKDIMNKSLSRNSSVVFVSWNSRVEFCPQGWINSSSPSTSKSQAIQWIESLNAGGGNEMRLAIETCMNKYSDVQEVYVMGDGDISPFTITGSNVCWTTFRKKYPNVKKFHFIALGSGASRDEMQKMAQIGNGSYYESN